jgi:RHS repeat-associated protein
VVLGDGFSVASGGRLTVATDPALDPEGEPQDAAQSYTYDRFGNLLSVTTERAGESDVTRTIGTTSTTNRLSVASYDLSGNVTAWAGRDYRYDPFNMLWQTKPTNGNGHTFVYGPGDERLWAIDWTAGAAASNWVSTWTLRDLDGTPLRQFRNVGENTTAANWSFHRDYVYRNGGLLATHTPEGLQHFHLDHLGSPRIITGANGTTLAQHLYFPFGEEATNPEQDGEVLKFTGHERDDLDASGSTRDLDYMHRRFHSPHLGRFFSPDELKRYEPLRTPQLYNRYSYVVGNPVNLVDPDGLRPLRATELQFFNAFFGADLSTVDVKGGLLGRAATAVAGTQGVTLGENVFLSPNASQGFDQGIRRSVALVGHELTHVLQYRHLGGQRFLDGYLQNYAFNRRSGQAHNEAYEDIIVEEVARKVQGVVFDFLSQNPDIEAKLDSGEAFSASEIALISSALQQAIDEGKLLEQGFQFIQGVLVRVDYVPK